MVSKRPLIEPCFSIALTAYSEQVGVYLQVAKRDLVNAW